MGNNISVTIRNYNIHREYYTDDKNENTGITHFKAVITPAVTVYHDLR